MIEDQITKHYKKQWKVNILTALFIIIAITCGLPSNIPALDLFYGFLGGWLLCTCIYNTIVYNRILGQIERGEVKING